jgi:hypothetical protein
LDADLIELGESEQEGARQPSAEVFSTFENDIEHILLDGFSPPPHRGA